MLAALAAVLLLGACGSAGESRLNPLNWFDGSRAEPVSLEPEGGWQGETVDNRALVAEVTALAVERMPGGAIIRATGLTPSQGWWDVELVEDETTEPEVLAYRLVAAPPRASTEVSTAASRRVTAAVFVSNRDLARVRRIVVRGQSNQRVAGR
ncbi:hypothetical protein C2I36_03095 [Rhodobacteraceae bacterium WD3A24]|nr:hypothetical protein C2I36_03095 [Rhodobacteraceae bacterium WD3A24]